MIQRACGSLRGTIEQEVVLGDTEQDLCALNLALRGRLPDASAQGLRSPLSLETQKVCADTSDVGCGHRCAGDGVLRER